MCTTSSSAPPDARNTAPPSGSAYVVDLKG
jgi:hypothetical protein